MNFSFFIIIFDTELSLTLRIKIKNCFSRRLTIYYFIVLSFSLLIKTKHNRSLDFVSFLLVSFYRKLQPSIYTFIYYFHILLSFSVRKKYEINDTLKRFRKESKERVTDQAGHIFHPHKY